MINVLMSRGILGSDMMVDALAEHIKPNMKVAVLLYSFFEDQFLTEDQYHEFYAKGSEYYDKIVGSFIPYGIPEKNVLWINYFTTTKEEATRMIESSDIIYFPGGSPDQMMTRIIQKGLKEVIEKHQKIYVGSSAGAMIQCHYYHISKDHDYKRFSYEEGLNLLQGFSIEVHYRRKKVQKSAMRKVFRSFSHPIFTIPDDGALIVFDEEIELLGTADLMYISKGVYR
jgi:peptidase E